MLIKTVWQRCAYAKVSRPDVNALDLSFVAVADRKALQIKAANNAKRVSAPGPPDWAADPGTSRQGALVETKTVWHPIGL